MELREKIYRIVYAGFIILAIIAVFAIREAGVVSTLGLP